MNNYESYAVYECPEIPTKKGKYIGKTPILKQARNICEIAKKAGKNYFIKGIKKDGTEVMFL